MKTICIILVAALVPCVIFAQNNTGNVTQSGNSNQAYIDQIGASNYGTIMTKGNSNDDATPLGGHTFYWAGPTAMGAQGVTQWGNTNHGTILQDASTYSSFAGMFQGNGTNWMELNQVGTGNVAYADQTGNSNGYYLFGNRSATGKGYIFQNGNGNAGFISEQGNNNNAQITQGLLGSWGGGGAWTSYGVNNSYGEILQMGDGNLATLEQYTGPGNVGVTQQTGTKNDSWQWQWGAGNQAFAKQNNTGSTSWNSSQQWQGLNEFYAYLGPVSGNEAWLDQNGTNDFSGQYQFSGNNNYSRVNQTGDNDYSFVKQTGNLNHAEADQYGGNNNWSMQLQTTSGNSSIVLQNGSFNWSFVSQH